MTSRARKSRQKVANLEAIVADYLARYGDAAQADTGYFIRQPSLKAAIQLAGHAQINGKRHPHQWRLSEGVMAEPGKRRKHAEKR